MLAIHKAIQPGWTNRFRAAINRKADQQAYGAAPASTENRKRAGGQDEPRFLGIRISTLMHPAHLG